jgi:hypothetical protein
LSFSSHHLLNSPTTNPPYPSSMFSTKGNQIILSLCALLGYYSDQWVDEPILGFFSIFSTDEKPTTQFDFSTFLANNIHEQFVNFVTEGMFWYSSILAYLFVFFQADKFSFSIQKMDGDGRPQAVTAWTSLLKHNSTEFSFNQFIEQFYHLVISMLSGRPEPRINDEVQRILHLSDHTKTGDWYLYQNHTEIKVYGCALAPYKLPKYLPVRIFALEYIRQMINSDDIQFVSLKKKKQLRIKGHIGSFICNNRGIREEADKLLKEMEAKMEKLVKEKEQLKPMEVIPLSAVPLSGVSTTSVTKVPSTNPLTSLEKTTELAKYMEEMNLQETEISRLKKEIENLQEIKSSYQINLSKEKHVSDQLKQELQ